MWNYMTQPSMPFGWGNELRLGDGFCHEKREKNKAVDQKQGRQTKEIIGRKIFKGNCFSLGDAEQLRLTHMWQLGINSSVNMAFTSASHISPPKKWLIYCTNWRNFSPYYKIGVRRLSKKWQSNKDGQKGDKVITTWIKKLSKASPITNKVVQLEDRPISD